MTDWRWVDLGAVDGPTMVNLFVAVAGFVGRNEVPPTILLSHPKAPFANVGYHQEAEREIDLEYCRSAGIPVVRRVVGGGAILDGPWEQDYMVIVPKDGPGTGAGVDGFYERYLAPVAAVLRRLGVPAERAGVNDLATHGRKVSANGALFLDGAWVLAGDILLDLDVALMTRVLRVPDEKFRHKLASGMAEWLTSLARELGHPVERSEVDRPLREEFARAFSVELRPAALTPPERERLAELRAERSGDEWTFLKDSSHPRLRGHGDVEPGRSVKIAGSTFLGRADLKAGKLLRATVLYRDGTIEEAEISGDFFTLPFSGAMDELERTLVGAPLKADAIEGRVSTWLADTKVRLVGVGPEDIVRVVLAAGAVTPTGSIRPAGPSA